MRGACIAALCGLLGAASACSSPPNFGFAVALTVEVDNSVPDTTLAQIVQLEISAPTESYDHVVPLGRAMMRTERVTYYPLAGATSLTINVKGLSVANVDLADGNSVIALKPKATTEAEVTLVASSAVPDAGIQDASLGDAAVHDAALPDLPRPVLDMAMAPDIGVACGVNAFCETFETGNLDSWRQNQPNENATSVVDNSRAQSGTHAWHITTAAQTATGVPLNAVLDLNQLWFMGKTELWTRVYMYVASPLPANYTNIFFLQQGGTPYDAVQVAINQAGTISYSNGLSNPTGYTASTTNMPTDAWVCFEHHVHIGNPGLVEMFLNGALLSGSLTGTTVASPQLDGFALNWDTHTVSNDLVAHSIWYDSIVLSTTRVGCSF